MPKVMHIGYYFDPEKAGRGGVVVYQWSLMKALKDLGWKSTFFAGTRHTFWGKPRTRVYSKEGIGMRELIDSPLRHCDFSCDPLLHTTNDEIDAITEKAIDSEKPDIIHVHDPRLHTASIVKVIRKKGLPVLKTIHNYFDLCPQGELMYRGTSACGDFKNGSRCMDCLPYLSHQSFLKEKMIGTFSGTAVYPLLKHAWREAQRFRKPAGAASEKARLSYPAEAYVQRRNRLVETLNSMDLIHCSSGYVSQLLKSNGVMENKLRVVPIASGSADLIRPLQPRRSPSTGPLVFAYLTGEAYNKGYETLLNAFRRLDQNRAQLKLFGFRDPETAANKYRGINVEFHGPYAPKELNGILAACDVGVVPSLWQEVFGLVGLEFLAAGLPVIASKVGGISEWLQDGENGYFVEPGDEEDLASKMELFLSKPDLIGTLRMGIRSPKSMKKHAHEVAALYNGLIKH